MQRERIERRARSFKEASLFLTTFLFVLPCFALAQSGSHGSSGSHMTQAERAAAANLLAATNQDRSAHGLQILHMDPMLTEAAWDHARRMVEFGTLSHQLPGEADLIFRVQKTGLHCSTVAENLAEAPTTEKINDEWMHSPSHRANLLDPRLNIAGIAVIEKHGELFAVEDFARSVASLTLSQQVNQVVTQLASRGLHAQGGQALAASYCDANPTRTRPLPKLIMRYSTVDLSRLPGQVEQGIATGTYRKAIVGACSPSNRNGFTAYQIVILLY